jgi:serine/threonine protein kinase/TolB-like protein/Flp pilus assembly protein TadD
VEECTLVHDKAAKSSLEAPAREAAKMFSDNRGQSLIGRQLGSYQVLSLLGAGGMGEVYRAHDSKLERDVAIKVLPAAFAHDPERLSRFQREAKMLASLNHPNIAAIYGLEEDAGRNFLVMELVPGETLRELIARGGALPVEEALGIARQIAEALEAAHEKSIIHRDLKPANVKVTPEGKVKVLDFGLAKAFAGDAAIEDLSNSPTLSRAATMPGVVLGTPAYMSPEQARGKPVDKRTDIWAFGCVLYELLTRKRPFDGETVSDTIAAVLEREPDWQALPPATPEKIRDLVRRCLQKDPQRRLRDLGDARIEIVEARTVPTPAERASAATTARATHPTSIWRRAALPVLALVAVALLAGGALAYYRLRPRSQIDSIAVLPFANAANDPNLDYQADGLTEELINSLTQAPNLKVMARATVFRYKGRALDPQEIGKELGVRAVLMGRVVRNGDRASVQADLVDTKDGSQLWGRQYNRTLAELQTIEEEIVQQVVSKLLLSGADQKRLAKRHTVNPQAYDLYLQGRRALSELTLERVRQSMVYFQQAIARDPNYAAAYAGLADSYSYLGIMEMAAPKDVMPNAKEAALKALELDNETAEAYTSLGIVQALYEWDWAGSGKRFQRAVELNPGGAYDQHWYGHYLEMIGQWQDAQNQMQKALALDPLNPMYGEDLGYDFFINRRYDQAVEQLRQVVELDPEDPIAHAFLALALEAKGLRSESLAENERARQYSGGATWVTGTIGGIYCRGGKRAEARKMLAELKTLGKQRYVSPLQPAVIHLALGEPEEGFRLLNSAAEERSVNLQYDVTDPTFDLVRRDPRLVSLRKKLGLPEAAWAVR